jgi:type IV pilus assembly protein PilM
MFFSDKKLVALDIGTCSVKLAELDFSGKGPVLRKFAVAPINPNMVQNGEIIEVGGLSQTIRGLVEGTRCRRKKAVSALSGNSIIIKKIAMPKMERKLVAEQLKWEAEQYIPFDINEISLEYHILAPRSSSESMEVLLVAAKQDYVFRVIETLEASALKCAVVDVAGFALANCFEANYGATERPVALLNIGGGITNFVVVDRGEVVFGRDMMVGGINYTSDISKAMGVSIQEAESLKISASTGQEVPDEVMSIIRSTNEQVVDEIKNCFDFFSAASGAMQVSRFFVSGGSVFVPGLVEQITKSTGLPSEPFDPFQRIMYDSRAFSIDYVDQIKAISPIVLGLGLRKVNDT